MLAWFGDTAVGCRGVYRVRRCDGDWWLHGMGHDHLPLLDLPPGGKRFTSLSSAQSFANELDRLVGAETHIGGE